MLTFSFSKGNYAIALLPSVFVLMFRRPLLVDDVYSSELSNVVLIIRFLRVGLEIKIHLNRSINESNH